MAFSTHIPVRSHKVNAELGTRIQLDVSLVLLGMTNGHLNEHGVRRNDTGAMTEKVRGFHCLLHEEPDINSRKVTSYLSYYGSCVGFRFT